MKITNYDLFLKGLGESVKMALVSDVHAGRPENIIEILKKEAPDYILLAGDIFENLDGSCDEKNNSTFALLRESARLAPTFYSSGNHEDGQCGSWWKLWKRGRSGVRNYSEENRRRIKESGVIYLEDSFVIRNGIAFGGLASGLLNVDKKPRLDWLEDFCALGEPKVLLCHHPEYYEPYLKERNVDLIVSGHAHGGQWRIFGRGVFAPGQGLFPKYTSGVHDSRLVISRGLKKSGIVPRIFNPCEVVIINLNKK